MTLTMGEITIGNRVDIEGPGESIITISGNDVSRIFFVPSSSTTTISGLTISNGNGVGSVDSGDGGGIYSKGRFTMNECTIISNSASGGGGIFLFRTATINSCLFTLNSGGNGGAVRNGGNTTINNSTFFDNEASGSGGAIASFKILTTNNCTFSFNEAGTFGGAINNTGIVTLNSCTIAFNRANDDGGALRVRNNGKIYNINSCTIFGNTTGGSGGGIQKRDSATVNLRNSIVAGNIATGSGPDLFDASATGIVSLGFNFIGEDTDVTFITTTGDQVGSMLSPLDPMLNPLANYGGETDTMPTNGGFNGS